MLDLLTDSRVLETNGKDYWLLDADSISDMEAIGINGHIFGYYDVKHEEWWEPGKGKGWSHEGALTPKRTYSAPGGPTYIVEFWSYRG